MRMLLVFCMLHLYASTRAQVYVDRIGFKLETIADLDIGWMKIYKPTSAPKPKQLGQRSYSATQIGYSQQFLDWMQQSYVPKGCLGDVGYYQNAVYKFSNTNSRLGNVISSHIEALPHLYGAYAMMYMFLKKDAAGKFVPQNNFAEYWFIESNQIQYISKPVSFISSTEEYYFLLPDYNGHPKGYEDSDDKVASNLSGFNSRGNIAVYKHFYIPPKVISDIASYVVIMTKNKELPFDRVTVGEFLTMAEKQLPVWQSVDPVSADQFAKAKKNLAGLKEKYKANLNDIAHLQLSTDISLIDFVNGWEGRSDFLDHGGTGEATFPVLKVNRDARERCKTNEPQWLVIRWTLGMPNQQFNIHLHESILNNFNFDYVYNYVFDPEKVKGQVYKPLRSPAFKEVVAVMAGSEERQKNSADKNVLFFEDFSTTAVGKKPVGWQTALANGGTTAVVSHPDGLTGAWAELRGHHMAMPLPGDTFPENFTLTYDVAASQNFTWGAKGLSMQLSRTTTLGENESYLMVRLRPGFDGRDGEATLETKFPSPPGYSNSTKWYKAYGFSNDKKANRVSVTIRKNGELLQVFIGKEKIAEYEKAIPLAHAFNTLSFDCSGNSAETDKYYISNIKMTKN